MPRTTPTVGSVISKEFAATLAALKDVLHASPQERTKQFASEDRTQCNLQDHLAQGGPGNPDLLAGQREQNRHREQQTKTENRASVAKTAIVCITLFGSLYLILTHNSGE